jgi:hypothetical protein
MRLHPYAPFGILIAVTIGGVALTNILEKTHNSMEAVPATSSIIKVTPKPVVVTPKTYYDSTKDECHMRDGSGVLMNFTKWLPGVESLCDKMFSTYNIKEYAKTHESGALVKPGRYDMVLGSKISDERKAKEAPPESPIYDTLQPGYVMGHGW